MLTKEQAQKFKDAIDAITEKPVVEKVPEPVAFKSKGVEMDETDAYLRSLKEVLGIRY
jgi:hypothetical protein